MCLSGKLRQDYLFRVALLHSTFRFRGSSDPDKWGKDKKQSISLKCVRLNNPSPYNNRAFY